MTIKSIITLAAFLFFTLCGNIFLKKAATEIPLSFSKDVAIHLFTSTSAIVGVICYGLAAVTWFIALSITPLNIAISVSACTYVLVIIVAWVLFNEPIPTLRWFGIGLVVAGLAVIGRSV